MADTEPTGHAHPHAVTGAAAHVSAHNPGAGQGPVVLDIGEDVGALVLHAGHDMVGREIEISPVGADEDRRHVEVLPRRTAAGVRYAAVYGSLARGAWTLWHGDGRPALVVDVPGGRVVEVSWPEREG